MRTDRTRTMAVIGVGAAAIVVVLLAFFLLSRDDDATGDASPTPSASATAAGTAASATAEPSGTAEPSVAPAEAVLTELLRVGDDETISFVVAIQPLGDDRFIAAVNTIDVAFIPPVGPSQMSGSVYIGTDEGGWERVDTGDLFSQLEITQLLAPPDGELVIYGSPNNDEEGPTAFTSTDGVTWTAADLSPAGGRLIAGGPLGYVMALRRESGLDAFIEIFRSDDAKSWESVHETDVGFQVDAVAAGDEGFVVTALRTSADESSPVTLASADGVEWFESADQPALDGIVGLRGLSALGGDWVAAGFSGSGDGIPVLWSANGLDWEEVARIEDPESREAFGYASHMVEAEGRVFLSAAFQAEGVESRPVNVWTSTDGRTWTLLRLADLSEVRAVIPGGPGILMAGREGDPAGDAVIWATNGLDRRPVSPLYEGR